MRLGLEEGRVIGCLIEKQLTTPQQYPLTLNALVLACNQSSNRDPVVSYDDRIVERALASMRETGVVRFLHPSHGRSVTRYGQALDERLGLDERRLALVAVLLLRGPQTAGELRARTERMATFDGLIAVDADLQHMSSGPEPLVVRLPRRPGQKEERWAQLLTPGGLDRVGDLGGKVGADRAQVGATEAAEYAPATEVGEYAPAAEVAESSSRRVRACESSGYTCEQFTALVAEVAILRADLAALRAELEGPSPERD